MVSCLLCVLHLVLATENKYKLLVGIIVAIRTAANDLRFGHELNTFGVDIFFGQSIISTPSAFSYIGG